MKRTEFQDIFLDKKDCDHQFDLSAKYNAVPTRLLNDRDCVRKTFNQAIPMPYYKYIYDMSLSVFILK